MNFSIYIHLVLMNLLGSIKISDKYKYYELMNNNDWMRSIPADETIDVKGFPLSIGSGKFEITDIGRTAMFNFHGDWISRVMAGIALLLSVIAIIISLMKK